MADAKALAKYEKKRLDVIKKLKAKGFEASFGGKGEANNHRTGLPYEEKCKEFYFPLKDSESFKDIIKSSDTVYMVSNQNNLIPECEFMENEGRAIIAIDVFPQGLAKPIYFEVLVRG